MNKAVEKAITTIEFGGVQNHEHVTVIPLLIAEGDGGPKYLTMGEALALELLTISEVSAGGSVPTLKVKNDADLPVLIIDGEELRGAKQNRVVNASMLLKEHSETIIPVSCTEHGRWSYRTDTFQDSAAIMYKKARSSKNRAVMQSLACEMSYRGDQHKVWEDVASLHEDLHTSSPTGAMSDAYDTVKERLEDWLCSFPLIENQVGLAVFACKTPAGLDLVSRSSAYKHLHARLLKSYVIDAMARPSSDKSVPAVDACRKHIASLGGLTETEFPSLGYGIDCRYESGTVCGSALVHDSNCVHAAFFWDEAQPDVSDRLHRYSQRRAQAFRRNRPQI